MGDISVSAFSFLNLNEEYIYQYCVSYLKKKLASPHIQYNVVNMKLTSWHPAYLIFFFYNISHSVWILQKWKSSKPFKKRCWCLWKKNGSCTSSRKWQFSCMLLFPNRHCQLNLVWIQNLKDLILNNLWTGHISIAISHLLKNKRRYIWGSHVRICNSDEKGRMSKFGQNISL